jgi:Protein of unknown function (DUF3147)
MQIGLDVSFLRPFRWKDYAMRFVFGGIITVVTGLIAGRYGPGVAGLFLAFPAIFPAGATLIEKQQREKKERAGFDGTSRGRVVAGIDAAGAAMGTLGLIAFAILIWRFLPSHSSQTILTIAGLAWLAISVLVWRIRKAMKKLKAARRRKIT